MNLAKRVMRGIVGLAAVVSLAACGATGSTSNSSAASSPSGSSSSESTASGNGGNSGDGKTIVVYWSGTGNTKKVAESIAKDANATLYELEPDPAYTQEDLNFNNENSRVVKEYQDKSLEDIKLKNAQVPNWDQYTTVYFGYPIWWQQAAWPVRNFIRDNDFSGKTVIPFCTSLSSPIGDSATNLEKLAKNPGTWKEGQRFSEDASADDVSNWVKGLQ